MKQTDFKEFKRAFGTLCELFEKEATAIMQAVYFKALSHYEIGPVTKAIEAAMIGCRFFPKPVELLELLDGGGKQALDDAAQLAALDVMNAVKRVGAYNTVVFEDPVTAAVIQEGFGGWVRICADLGSKSEKWFCKDFAAMYTTFQRSGRRFNGKLLGLVEAANQERGFNQYLPEPVMIGKAGTQKLIN